MLHLVATRHLDVDEILIIVRCPLFRNKYVERSSVLDLQPDFEPSIYKISLAGAHRLSSAVIGKDSKSLITESQGDFFVPSSLRLNHLYL